MSSPTSYRVLVVDDSNTVLMGVSGLLQQAGFVVETAENGESALKKVRSFSPHCVLVDFFMPGMTGDEVVEQIREFDSLVQIVLITGQSSRKPAREMMSRLDIQGYYDKASGLQGILVWVDAAVKAWQREMTSLRRARALERIVTASERLHRLHPPSEMGAVALEALARVCEVDGPVSGFCATVDMDGVPRLHETVGHFENCTRFTDLDDESSRICMAAYKDEQVIRSEQSLALPVKGGSRPRTVFFLDVKGGSQVEDEHLTLIGHQVALAMENFRLFEMATKDAVTGLLSRAHLMNRFRESLKLAIRRESPLSVLVIDLNDFKVVNDTWGHPAGDAALAHFGDVIRDCVRDVDLAGRIGGDEFLVILKDCFPRLATKIAERIQRRLNDQLVEYGGEHFQLSASIGAGGFTTLPLMDWMRSGWNESVWHALVNHFVGLVDEATYAAKDAETGVARAGGDGDLETILTQFAKSEAVEEVEQR